MTSARARELVSKFRTQRVLVVGDVMLDRYVFGTVDRISSEAPVPILHAREGVDLSGGAGNTAKNLARLGAVTSLVSVVGNDDAGERIRDVLRQEHVEPLIVTDHGRPTTEKIRYVQKGHQLLRVDFEEKGPLAADSERAVLATIAERIRACDALVVSDYAKGVLTPAIAGMIVASAHAAGVTLAVDWKPKNARYFRGASFVSPNLKEAQEFLAASESSEPERMDELAAHVSAALDTDVYLTLGEQGIYVYSRANGRGSLVPQLYAQEIFDVSGAGDTALAVLTLAAVATASPSEAAELANAGAAVVVAKIGAVALSSEELLGVFDRVPEKAEQHAHT